ncbi:cupin domain-containing protein [Deinococcus pimensis]|uniref:cupin domain-containing protein n=1 Tax=Deinococcus pimensis TaxID=309888 RepID=UPI0004B7558E|nr:cupin domain-containing protein [Deinococcus pimensis]
MNPTEPVFVRRVTRDNTYDLRADRFSVLLSGEDTGGRLAVLDLCARRSFELPVHVHRHEDELIAVMEGRLGVHVGDRYAEAAPGQVLLLPRGVPHALHVLSDTARLCVTYSPAGFEHFLREVARPAVGFWPDAPGPPDVPRLVAVGERYGLQFFPGTTTLEDV